MTPRKLTNLEWMKEMMKAKGKPFDFETLVEFMIWLQDNEGVYLKEEVKMIVKEFLGSIKR